MSIFKRKANISLAEFHRYVDDIATMQQERQEAMDAGKREEMLQLDTNILIALRVQERLLEKVGE